jgi:hypothetical protein
MTRLAEVGPGVRRALEWWLSLKLLSSSISLSQSVGQRNVHRARSYNLQASAA